jgi:hypothetical protein
MYFDGDLHFWAVCWVGVTFIVATNRTLASANDKLQLCFIRLVLKQLAGS